MVLSFEQFLAQKLITEMDHPPSSPDLASNDFWLLPKIKSALQGQDFKILKTTKKKKKKKKIVTTALKVIRQQELQKNVAESLD
jgi:hypothetical protein